MTPLPGLRAYVEEARRRAATVGARAVLCDIAVHLGARPADIATLALFRGWASHSPDPRLAPPSGWTQPDLLGLVREALIEPDDRRRDGAFYTPVGLADAVAMATLEPLLDRSSLTVCDPAAGGGALLLAAARVLADRQARHPSVRLVAVDRDRLALAVTEVALRLAAPEIDVICVEGDALGALRWPDPGLGAFDAVLANPPFLNQLARLTVRTRPEAAAAQDRFGPPAAGYADTAVLFALLAVDLVRAGGRIGLILPEPILATRDGAAARARIGQATDLDRLWLEPAATFAAGARVAVTILQLPARAPARPRPADDRWATGDWASLGADALGVPDGHAATSGTLADIAATSADFRDQFYGVARVAIDDPTAGGRLRPKLITSGLIDPLADRWGVARARVDGRDFRYPSADLSALDEGDALRRWAATRLVPKALLATQTAVLEAIADPTGCLLPMVPVISVVPHDPADLWRILAVLTAPPVSAIARRRSAGAALSRDAIKLSARQVAALPLPMDLDAWETGAHAAARASSAGDGDAWSSALRELGAAMCTAYRVEPQTVMPWWWARVERGAARRKRSLLAAAGSIVSSP